MAETYTGGAPETYPLGTAPMRTNPKRVKWAKWLLKRGGNVAATNTIRQLQSKVLASY